MIFGNVHEIFKNYDESEAIEEFVVTTKILELIDETLPSTAKVGKLPECLRLNLVRPKNLQGIDYTSMKVIQRIDLSYRDSQIK